MSYRIIRWVSGCLAFAGLVLFATSDSNAGRVFISQTAPNFGDDVDLGITSADASIPAVPTINVDPGVETTLYVWFRPAFRVNAAADEKYPGYSYNIEASGSGLQAVSHMTLNPPSFSVDDGDYVGPPRWTSAVNGAPQAGTTLVGNALALTASGSNLGIGNSNSTFINDGARDGMAAADVNASRSFALGKLVVRADAAAANQTIGLYFRVGSGGWLVRNANATTSSAATLQFGNSAGVFAGDQFGQGDAITADLALADAIIHVNGPPPPTRLEIIQFEPDPNNHGMRFTTGPPSNTRPVNFMLTPPSNMVQVEALGVQHSFFDVFFDINVDDPATLQQFAAGLMAQESDEGLNFVRVIPNGENTLGLGRDFDLQLQYRNDPGSNRFLDVDASSVPGLVINNVAIPEPSTWALVACGLLGLAMARRRRRVA